MYLTLYLNNHRWQLVINRAYARCGNLRAVRVKFFYRIDIVTVVCYIVDTEVISI